MGEVKKKVVKKQPVKTVIVKKKVVKKKKVNKLKPGPILLLLIIIGIGLFCYKSCNKENKVEENKIEIVEKDDNGITNDYSSSELSLIMVGDCLIHGAIYKDAEENGTYNFYKMVDLIKPIIEPYDLAFYNQESLLGGTEIGLSTYPTFNSPQEVGDAFLDAGFNLVSLANNHTLDKGQKGLDSSLQYWDEKEKEGIMTAGSYTSFEDRDQDVIMEVNGIKYTLLAYTTTTNGLNRPKGKEYYLNVYDPDQVKADIERLRDKVDLLLVSMHWGEEYHTEPTQGQEEIAAYLASLGVDIIIGTHPHVIEPIEFIGNTMVIYSLGNFIASQNSGQTKDGRVARHTGLMVSVTVKKVTINGKSTIYLVDPTAQLSYAYSNNQHDYEMYTYDMLNDNLLSGYHDYFNKYMKIVTSRTDKILYNPI